ncbi:hypothetical protein HPP92_010579 [Vanilla planifolia]|uniref:Uncharacterized protein n=1 Tax=Vanilla planifolia TaxID=51239 RepID=A0A835QZB2_VANPL|nr:hypothetical protein HPP92_010579 [Vanilla planifolia]
MARGMRKAPDAVEEVVSVAVSRGRWRGKGLCVRDGKAGERVEDAHPPAHFAGDVGRLLHTAGVNADLRFIIKLRHRHPIDRLLPPLHGSVPLSWPYSPQNT